MNFQSFAFVEAFHSPNTSQFQPPPLDLDLTDLSSTPASFGEEAWTIYDPETYLPCIKLQGIIKFKIAINDVTNPEETEWIQVPETALATGHCHSLWSDYQDIRLSWEEYEQINIFGPEDDSVFNLQHTSYSSYSIYFGFATSWQSEFSDLIISPSEFALNSVTIVVEKDGSDQNPVSISVSDFVDFTTPKNTTFSCSTIQFEIGELKMTITDFLFQAFNTDEIEFDPIFKCETDNGKQDKTVLEHLAHGMGWIFISFFALCLFGVILVLLVGGFNKRHDIIAFGYKFVQNNAENQSSEA